MTEIDVSIIIVSRNVSDLLRDCLKSIFDSSNDLTIEVIVVDNASTDDTVSMTSSLYPQVKLIVNQENVGFPKANNQAVRLANGRYILFLNPDTIVSPGTLHKIVDFMDLNNSIGALGPKILDSDGNVQYDCARNFPDLWGCLTEISFLRRIFPKSYYFGHQYMSYWDHHDSRSVPCLVGAAMLVRRAALESIGWFMDETIPMYFEDVDYCYRIHQSGWGIYYFSEAIIKHWGSQSTKKSNNQVRYELLKWEAYRLFFERYRSPREVLLLRGMVFTFGIVRIPFISIGILLRPLLPPSIRPFFSHFTIRKSIALVGWSLGIVSHSRE